MFKKNKYNSKNSNKGFLALDQLVGLTLSIMALIMLIYYFVTPYLLYTPTNLIIAKSNAESIKNFIDFSSSGNYENLNNCYNILRLHNLENFQTSKKDNIKNYAYVIDNKRIYVIPFKSIETFVKTKSVNGLYIYKTDDFNSGDINLIFDKTDQGWIISDKLFFFIPFGQADSKLDINDQANYILLYPKISDGSVIGNTIDNTINEDYLQNLWISKIYSEGDSEDPSGKVLVYRNDNKKLFVTNGDISEAIISNLLCSHLYLNKKDMNNYYLSTDEQNNYINLDEVPYTSKKIVIKIKLQSGEYDGHVFEWIKSRPVCYYNDNNCVVDDLNTRSKNFYNDIINSKNVNMLIKNIRNYIAQCDIDEGTVVVRVVDLTQEDMNNIEVRFSDVFDELYDDNGESINIYTLSTKERKKYVFSLTSFFNTKFNGYRTDFSNDVAIKDNQAYFFVNYNGFDRSKSKIKYYLFKSQFLDVKNSGDSELEFYFNGKKIEYDKVELDKYGIHIPFLNEDDNKYFYILHGLEIQGLKYDIVLTVNQVSKANSIG